MAQPDSLPSGHDPEYRAFRDQQRQAERLLARIELNEDFALEWERFPQIYTDVVGRDLEWGQQRFASTYRAIVGVLPSERESLRRELENIIRTGHGTVDEAIAAARSSAAQIIGQEFPTDPTA